MNKARLRLAKARLDKKIRAMEETLVHANAIKAALRDPYLATELLAVFSAPLTAEQRMEIASNAAKAPWFPMTVASL